MASSTYVCDHTTFLDREIHTCVTKALSHCQWCCQSSVYTHTHTNTHTQTYTGNILVSVNPYKMCDIYDMNMVARYQGQLLGKLPP